MSKELKFKKPDINAYDGEKANRYLADEFGQWAIPDPNFNLQDFIKKAKSRRNNSSGFATQKVHDLIFLKPKNKK